MDVYQTVTDRIIAELESGAIPWNKPWTGLKSGAISRATGKPYSLLNQLLLGKPGEYMTFKHCKDLGGRIKKGAKAKYVVLWRPFSKEKKDKDGSIIVGDDGLPEIENLAMLRMIPVFHIDDCEDVEPLSIPEETTTATPIESAQRVLDGYVSRSGVKIRHSKQDEAYYSPGRDLISLPLMEQFRDAVSYYETAFHESVHSTGHHSRLNRINPNEPDSCFGSEKYAKEELVAELGACMLLHDVGIATDSSTRNNAAYIQSWISRLRNDKRLIVSAASRAEKAVKLIADKQDEKEDENVNLNCA